MAYYSLAIINDLIPFCNIKNTKYKIILLLRSSPNHRTFDLSWLSFSMCTSQWSVDFWYDMVLNTIAVAIPGCTVTLFTSPIIPLCSVQQEHCCTQGHHHIWQRMNKTYKKIIYLLMVYFITLSA